METGSFVITDRASQGGQEGDLSAGTRDGSGREKCETRNQRKDPVSPQHNKGGCCGREALLQDAAVPFSGMITPVFLLVHARIISACSFIATQPQAKQEAGAGHKANSLMTVLCIMDFQ